MKAIPESIERAIEAFSRLPGIGRKTAERLAFYLLKKPEQDIRNLGEAIAGMKEGIRFCENCKNLSTKERCDICEDDNRNKNVICVVEDALDLIAIEKTGEYKGLYHVLHGLISPVEGIGPEELTITDFAERIKSGEVKEIILALNPSMEGEATSAYLMKDIKPLDIKVTRIARGIPVGGDLEYADSQTLKRALEGRMEY